MSNGYEYVVEGVRSDWTISQLFVSSSLEESYNFFEQQQKQSYIFIKLIQILKVK